MKVIFYKTLLDFAETLPQDWELDLNHRQKCLAALYANEILPEVYGFFPCTIGFDFIGYSDNAETSVVPKFKLDSHFAFVIRQIVLNENKGESGVVLTVCELIKILKENQPSK